MSLIAMRRRASSVSQMRCENERDFFSVKGERGDVPLHRYDIVTVDWLDARRGILLVRYSGILGCNVGTSLWAYTPFQMI